MVWLVLPLISDYVFLSGDLALCICFCFPDGKVLFDCIINTDIPNRKLVHISAEQPKLMCNRTRESEHMEVNDQKC